VKAFPVHFFRCKTPIQWSNKSFLLRLPSTAYLSAQLKTSSKTPQLTKNSLWSHPDNDIPRSALQPHCWTSAFCLCWFIAWTMFKCNPLDIKDWKIHVNVIITEIHIWVPNNSKSSWRFFSDETFMQEAKHYTHFQCYVHRRHLHSSFDMPSFDMLSNLAHIKMLTQLFHSRTWFLVIKDGFIWHQTKVRSIKKSFCER